MPLLVFEKIFSENKIFMKKFEKIAKNMLKRFGFCVGCDIMCVKVKVILNKNDFI